MGGPVQFATSGSDNAYRLHSLVGAGPTLEIGKRTNTAIVNSGSVLKVATPDGTSLINMVGADPRSGDIGSQDFVTKHYLTQELASGLLPTNKTTIVANYAALIAQTGIYAGDQTFVNDASGDPNQQIVSGDWGMYLYTGTQYDLLSTAESAAADATTFTRVLDGTSAASGVIGTIGANTRVTGVDVQISSACGTTPTSPNLTIGDSGSSTRLFNSATMLDWTDADLYQMQLSYKYSTGSQILYAFTPGSNVTPCTITITVFLAV